MVKRFHKDHLGPTAARTLVMTLSCFADIHSPLLCAINHVVASPDEGLDSRCIDVASAVEQLAEGYKNCESVAPTAKLFIARFAAAQEMQRLLTSDRDDHKEPLLETVALNANTC